MNEMKTIILRSLLYPNCANNDDAILGNVKSRKSDQVFFKQIELNTKNSTKRQQSCRLVEFLVFNSACGAHRSLINTQYIIIHGLFSAIPEKRIKSTFLQTEHFISYIRRNFNQTRKTCLKVFSAIADNSPLLIMYQVLISDLCAPQAELNTKNSTKRQLCCRLVEFLVFNSIGQLKTW